MARVANCMWCKGAKVQRCKGAKGKGQRCKGAKGKGQTGKGAWGKGVKVKS